MSSITEFLIQYYRESDDRWCDSAFHPNVDVEGDEREVWVAFVKYLSVAYPNTQHRLVSIMTVQHLEVIDV